MKRLLIFRAQTLKVDGTYGGILDKFLLKTKYLSSHYGPLLYQLTNNRTTQGKKVTSILT